MSKLPYGNLPMPSPDGSSESDPLRFPALFLECLPTACEASRRARFTGRTVETAMVPPVAAPAGFPAAAIFLFARDGDGDDVVCAMPLRPVPTDMGFFALAVTGSGIATAVTGVISSGRAHRGRRSECDFFG